MTVRVTYSTSEITFDQVFSGATPDAVVAAMQKEVASQLSFVLRLFVNAMTPTQFAQEVMRRYNESTNAGLHTPQNCLEFIRIGEQQGIVTVLQP
jgi:hypothetical protein